VCGQTASGRPSAVRCKDLLAGRTRAANVELTAEERDWEWKDAVLCLDYIRRLRLRKLWSVWSKRVPGQIGCNPRVYPFSGLPALTFNSTSGQSPGYSSSLPNLFIQSAISTQLTHSSTTRCRLPTGSPFRLALLWVLDGSTFCCIHDTKSK
jgi:hypothetical protein